PLRELRKYRGSFGQPLDYWKRNDILKKIPSYAKKLNDPFPPWKQNFIRKNRELYKRYKGWIEEWLEKIISFPPSYQKMEWNCQGEERNIWEYIIQFRASGVRIKRPTTSPSLVAMNTTQVPIIAWEKRYMNIRECARLQSMDKLKHLPEGNLAYTALGNAVNVDVAFLILNNFLQ
ncbi:MAG: DNA cytosine methyltransferase, partial [Candidatus Neomarinimicrobiota bacterium]